jgi:hypothetical protein
MSWCDHCRGPFILEEASAHAMQLIALTTHGRGDLKVAGMVWAEVLELEADTKWAQLAADILASDLYQTDYDGQGAGVPAAGRRLSRDFRYC